MVRGRCRRPEARSREASAIASRFAASLLATVRAAPTKWRVHAAGAAPQMPPAFKENRPTGKPAQPADQLRRGAWWEIFRRSAARRARGRRSTCRTRRCEAQQARFRQARAAIAHQPGGSRYPQVTTSPQITTDTESRQPRERHARTSASRISCCRWTCRTRPTCGAGCGSASRPPSRARRRAPRIWRRCACRCTPSWRSTTSSCAALDAEQADPRRLRRRLPARARADAEPVRRRHRVAGGRRAGRDAARVHARAGGRPRRAARGARTRDCRPHRQTAVVLAALPSSPLDEPATRDPDGAARSDLLERRPDIAAAERRIAAAGAEVGIAQAAFFPRLFLTATAGFESRVAHELVERPEHVLVGRAGRRGDALRRRTPPRRVGAGARGLRRDGRRSTRRPILRSLQEVEDSLATLRVLREEADIQAAAVAAAERSVTLATNRYRGGVTSYLEVIAAQNAALTNQRTAAVILSRRLAASVLLIKALGGGWTSRRFPRSRPTRRAEHEDSPPVLARSCCCAGRRPAARARRCPYPEQIAAWHAEKDRFMRESSSRRCRPTSARLVSRL